MPNDDGSLNLGVDVDRDRATPWVVDSLERGSPIAVALIDRVKTSGRFTLSVTGARKSEIDVIGDFSQGIYALGMDSTRHAGAMLGGHVGSSTLVVEDDMWVAGDEISYPPTAIATGGRLRRWGLPPNYRNVVGPSLLRWREVDAKAPSRALELFDEGSSYCPLNAYQVAGSPAELGLADGAEVGAREQARIAAAVSALFVSALDDESYMVWQCDSPPGRAPQRVTPKRPSGRQGADSLSHNTFIVKTYGWTLPRWASLRDQLARLSNVGLV